MQRCVAQIIPKVERHSSAQELPHGFDVASPDGLKEFRFRGTCLGGGELKALKNPAEQSQQAKYWFHEN
jgi:hypothetical protein